MSEWKVITAASALPLKGPGWWAIALSCEHEVMALHGATSPIGEADHRGPRPWPGEAPMTPDVHTPCPDARLFVRVNNSHPTLAFAEWELQYVVTDGEGNWLYIVQVDACLRVVYEREIAAIVEEPS